MCSFPCGICQVEGIRSESRKVTGSKCRNRKIKAIHLLEHFLYIVQNIARGSCPTVKNKTWPLEFDLSSTDLHINPAVGHLLTIVDISLYCVSLD